MSLFTAGGRGLPSWPPATAQRRGDCRPKRRTVADLALVAAAASVVGACASGGVVPEDGGGDAGPPDAGSVADAGCPDGTHRCGGGCIDDLANEPDNGCRLGCGEPCRSPDLARGTCGADGQCGFECVAPGAPTADGLGCECRPQTCTALGAFCGEVADGCGGFANCGTCADGADCVAGICECETDPGEPNESSDSPHDLPAFTDSPRTDMDFNLFRIGGNDDEDWFRFAVSDDFDAGNPDITVSLDLRPTGENYNLAVFYVCGSGEERSTCSEGSTANTIGRGCSSQNGGDMAERVVLNADCHPPGGICGCESDGDDAGTAYIRVQKSGEWMGSCGPYRLRVSVD